MASAAEQLASSLSLGVFSKATELKNRIWFTLGALIVYRIGTYVPVPGVDASVMGEMLSQHGGGILLRAPGRRFKPIAQDAEALRVIEYHCA